MLRATFGTWINYATTLAFQILFVARFGTTSGASAYILAFAIVISVVGIMVSTAQTVVSGRLMADGDRLRSGALKLLTGIVVVAAVFSVAVLLLAPQLGGALSRATHYGAEQSTALFRIGSAVCFLQVLGGAAAVIDLVRGYRFAPTIAPAMPTLTASIALAFLSTLTPVGAFELFALGSVFQVVIVAIPALSGIKVAREPILRTGSATVLMVVSLSLLSLVLPIERAVVGLHSVRDIAAYDYGMRSLRAVQQLIVGGAMLATLGDWSSWHLDQRRKELMHRLVSSVAVLSIAFTLAASIAAVAGRAIVALTYQHGAFTASDTTAVLGVVLFGLPGFCAEGVGLVLTSALAGARYNVALAMLGFANFASRVLLALLLGRMYGALGVAAAYSVISVAVLLPTIYLVATRLMIATVDLGRLRPVLIVSGGTIASALVLATLASQWPAALRGAVVIAICGLLITRFKPVSNLEWRTL